MHGNTENCSAEEERRGREKGDGRRERETTWRRGSALAKVLVLVGSSRCAITLVVGLHVAAETTPPLQLTLPIRTA